MNRSIGKSKIAPGVLVLAAVPFLMGSECEKPLVTDSGFDLWCGDTLCDWQVDEGTVAKVPTWHERDYGVELQGAQVRISQLLPATSDDVSCLHFELLADIDDPVNVVLALDFDDNGSIEQTETLANGHWIPTEYRITPPTYFHTLRISITKLGDGHAVLAQIQASSSSDCAAPPLSTLDRPLGATCESEVQCAQGQCLSRALAEELLPDTGTPSMACEACAQDSDCAAGSVCGLGWSALVLEPFAACAPAGGGMLGDRCRVGPECATGVCCGGVCSTCCLDGGPGCSAGGICAERARDANQLPWRAAWQCAPGGHGGVAGDLCLGSDDCASGSCTGEGTFSVCGLDGRLCTASTDCPSASSGNSCIPLGVAGGKCQ